MGATVAAPAMITLSIYAEPMPQANDAAPKFFPLVQVHQLATIATEGFAQHGPADLIVDGEPGGLPKSRLRRIFRDEKPLRWRRGTRGRWLRRGGVTRVVCRDKPRLSLPTNCHRCSC